MFDGNANDISPDATQVSVDIHASQELINSKCDLARWLEQDCIALGHSQSGESVLKRLAACVLASDRIWQFQKTLRWLEYYTNQRQTRLVRLRRLLVYRRYLRLGEILGVTIPPNVFGPGLSIAHAGTIVVNKGARVGKNCRLHVCVNIGTAAGLDHEAPTLGNNVYIGPGAKIFGPITIADNCAIGANAVVNKSFTTPNSLIAGVPAKHIGEVDTRLFLKTCD